MEPEFGVVLSHGITAMMADCYIFKKFALLTTSRYCELGPFSRKYISREMM